jgi:hypothetical protein
MAHRIVPVPTVCQDAYCLSNSKRLIAAVCDGAGSSVMSELGSQQLSQSIVRLVYSLEPIIEPLLDTEENQTVSETLAQIIYQYAIKLLQDIAVNYKRNAKDFRSTLLLIITGKENAFWFKVGDGEIVVENNERLSCVGQTIKGEYANETVFIDESLHKNDVQYGLLNTAFLSGIAVMTDGSCEKLVSTDRENIADRLSKYFTLLRNSKLPRAELYKFLNDYKVWRGSSHDDKTLVLAARTIPAGGSYEGHGV